jgi:hypothetical protein
MKVLENFRSWLLNIGYHKDDHEEEEVGVGSFLSN